MNADELANRLEKKAKELREKGLTDEHLDKISGGSFCTCCGSNCTNATHSCASDDEFAAICVSSCVNSSSD